MGRNTMTEQEHVARELRDTLEDLEACEHADADGRVQDHAAWLNRYWTLHDRALELERRLNTLQDASTATQSH